MSLKPEIVDRIKALEEKYAAMGQDMLSYLDGLIHADYLTYWDYIAVDSLLSLQKPKTSIPDEMIFIGYHQITELYFKLVLWEMQQLQTEEAIEPSLFLDKVRRINRYFENLCFSFDTMVDGMDPKQFLKFRMSLLPASGFQSGQYRMIEISSSDFVRLVGIEKREFYEKNPAPIEEMYEHLYWKRGSIEMATNKKTLTLKQFEGKYTDEFIRLAKKVKTCNVWQQYKKLSAEAQAKPELKKAMRQMDALININWPLSHYKSAVKYLQKDPEDIRATGGTNWQKYLPPKMQMRMFFPDLWSAGEKETWGKHWMEEEHFKA